jgi:PilZ domain-containing protein
VNQRRESRLAADTPVKLKVLGMLGEPTIDGCVKDMSGSGLRVSVPLPIPCGASVRVEGKEMVMLGEVCRCEPDQAGYSVGVILSELRARSN